MIIANQMASQLCETKLSYHTCVNHLWQLIANWLSDSVIAGATLHRNNSKIHKPPMQCQLQKLAKRERERVQREGRECRQAAICRVIIHGTLGILVHIEAFAKRRSQMTSKSGKSLFTPQTRWQAWGRRGEGAG